MSTLNPFEGLSPGQRKVAVIGGAGVVGLLLWNRHKPASAASTQAAATPTDTTVAPDAGTTPDPATSDPMAGYTGVQTFPGTGGGGATTSTPTILDNAAWSQAVQAGLSSIGYDPVEVSKALGDWFDHRPLDSTERQIVEAAIAEYGAPPGGDLPILSQGTTPPTPPPPPHPDHDVTIPHVIGMTQDAALQELRAAHLDARTSTPGKPGEVLVVTSQHPRSGLVVEPGTDVTVTSARGIGRKPPKGVPVRRKPPVERTG